METGSIPKACFKEICGWTVCDSTEVVPNSPRIEGRVTAWVEGRRSGR